VPNGVQKHSNLLLNTHVHHVLQSVFENSAEGGKSDLTDSVSFWKIQKKNDEIQPKRTGDDGGTVKTKNTKIWSVFPENWRGDFRVNFARNRTIFTENR
jgi:hypothetical protein